MQPSAFTNFLYATDLGHEAHRCFSGAHSGLTGAVFLGLSLWSSISHRKKYGADPSES